MKTSVVQDRHQDMMSLCIDVYALLWRTWADVILLSEMSEVTGFVLWEFVMGFRAVIVSQALLAGAFLPGVAICWKWEEMPISWVSFFVQNHHCGCNGVTERNKTQVLLIQDEHFSTQQKTSTVARCLMLVVFWYRRWHPTQLSKGALQTGSL